MASEGRESYAIDGWMVAWNSNDPTNVMVGKWPDTLGWDRDFVSADGCCQADFHDLSPECKISRMFIIFHTLIVGEKMNPHAVHAEFLKIKEYRRRISPDIPGAEFD